MTQTMHSELTAVDLSSRHCKPCEGGVPPLPREEIERDLKAVPGWQLLEPQGGTSGGNRNWPQIARDFKFDNFYHTIAFVNAVAWMANVEGHHPDLDVGYSTCRVRYSTHAIRGLTENDFICAAKINALLPEKQGKEEKKR